ncbi:membrane dipeptidase [Mesorhizobium sp. M0518]
MSQPTIFSDSNAYGICQHGRNICDDQIRAWAVTGCCNALITGAMAFDQQ